MPAAPTPPITLTLQRTGQVGAAMMGVLTAQGVTLPTIYTLEHRWRNNEPKRSCVPAGTYLCRPWGWAVNAWQKFKRVWELVKVPGRTAVLMHNGNTVNDTEGCILVGLSKSGAFVGNSVKALDLLRQVIGEREFTLVILDPKPVQSQA